MALLGPQVHGMTDPDPGHWCQKITCRQAKMRKFPQSNFCTAFRWISSIKGIRTFSPNQKLRFMLKP